MHPLAHALGNKLIALLNNIETRTEVAEKINTKKNESTIEQMSLFELKVEYKVGHQNKTLSLVSAGEPCR